VYDSEDNDAKAGNVAEVAEEPFDGVAFGGERSEFGSQSGEEQDGEPTRVTPRGRIEPPCRVAKKYNTRGGQRFEVRLKR
jgi:hypothetical protein